MSIKKEEIQVTKQVSVMYCDFCAEKIPYGVDPWYEDGATRIADYDLHNRCILTELGLAQKTQDNTPIVQAEDTKPEQHA